MSILGCLIIAAVVDVALIANVRRHCRLIRAGKRPRV